MNLLYCGDSNIKDGLFLSIKSILKVEKGTLNIYVLSMDYLNYKKIDSDFITYLDTLVKEVNKDSYVYKKNPFKKDYLNSGVLLLNLDLLKKEDILRKAREMCATKRMLLPDQSALNILCKHKLIVDRKYNEQKAMQDDTVLRHFTTTFKFFPRIKTQKVKPWQIDRMHDILNCHEFDWLLDEYKEFLKMNKKIIPIFFTPFWN